MLFGAWTRNANIHFWSGPARNWKENRKKLNQYGFMSFAGKSLFLKERSLCFNKSSNETAEWQVNSFFTLKLAPIWNLHQYGALGFQYSMTISWFLRLFFYFVSVNNWTDCTTRWYKEMTLMPCAEDPCKYTLFNTSELLGWVDI